MRYNLYNGNGCLCDVCGSMLMPKEVVKIKAQQLSPDPDKACRGSYVVFASMDLCQKCYDELLAGQMENAWIKRERQHEINAERERRKQREKGK